MSSTALQLHEAERPTTALIRPVVNPEQVLAIHEAIAAMVQRTLVEGTDFGIIPGTKKPSMYKSGAERLCVGFGLVDRYEIIDTEIDHTFRNEWEKRGKKGEVYASGVALGLYRYTVKCFLYRREDNALVAEGVGAASSLETKYCDRPRDVENTILKMAKKRAKVDATLTGLGLSDRFTQDVEDMDRGVVDEDGQRTARPRGQEVASNGAPKPAAEKRFPWKGPFKDKPIGEMPIDAIEGYVKWIAEKRLEKNEPEWAADIVESLVEVRKQKIEERDRDQVKMDLDGQGTAVADVGGPPTARADAVSSQTSADAAIASPAAAAESKLTSPAEQLADLAVRLRKLLDEHSEQPKVRDKIRAQLNAGKLDTAEKLAEAIKDVQAALF